MSHNFPILNISFSFDTKRGATWTITLLIIEMNKKRISQKKQGGIKQHSNESNIERKKYVCHSLTNAQSTTSLSSPHEASLSPAVDHFALYTDP